MMMCRGEHCSSDKNRNDFCISRREIIVFSPDGEGFCISKIRGRAMLAPTTISRNQTINCNLRRKKHSGGSAVLQCVKKVPNLDVIANQPAGWCGNPLQSSKNPPTINEKCLKIQGIPTPVCALARNDMGFRQSETPPGQHTQLWGTGNPSHTLMHRTNKDPCHSEGAKRPWESQQNPGKSPGS